MFQTFKNAWKIPDLRKKMLFTLMIILLYRIGARLFVPFVNVDLIADHQNTQRMTSGVFGMLNLFSGGAFEHASLFALSVSPYITASIVVQLLTIAIPALERLSKQGDEGKKKINQITRIITVVLSLITAFGYVRLLEGSSASDSFLLVQRSDGAMYYFAYATMIAAFCAGASIIMWLAERINDYGIGNGISIILFANIISRGGTMLTELRYLLMNAYYDTSSGVWVTKYGFDKWKTGWSLVGGIAGVVAYVAVFAALIGFIVWFTNSERRIPIQYAKRVVGRKMYGGQNSNLPLKLNMAGVMPIIFASSIVSILPTIAGFLSSTNGFRKFVDNWLNQGTPLYIISYIVLIWLFSYFYIMISFNPVEVSNNIRSQGGSVPGIRPGKPTSDYIKKILNRITTLGALFLILVAGVPMIIGAAVPNLTKLATFGGSSLLILVGVALETAQQLEAQMSMRNYKGFLDN